MVCFEIQKKSYRLWKCSKPLLQLKLDHHKNFLDIQKGSFLQKRKEPLKR